HLRAIEASDYAFALDPGNAAALQLRAELVRDREGLLPALDWFEKALDQSPDNVALLGEYAATLGDAGEAVRMLAATRRMLELDPGNPRAFYLQSVMAARAGKYRLARKLLSLTEGKLAAVPGAMLLEGILEIAARNYTLAIEALDPLVRRQPDNQRAGELLARAIFLSGEYKLLIGRFAMDARREDASPYLQMLVARAYEQLDERDRAAQLLDSVASVRGRQITARPASGPIGKMLAGGNTSGAEARVSKWLAANPGNFDNLALAGDVQLAKGNARKAMRYYERAAKIRVPPSLLSRRFQAMLMAGAMEQAVRLSETSLANNPASFEARRIAAWLSVYSGDWVRARGLYENLVGKRRARDLALLSDLALVQIKAGAPEQGAVTAQRAYRLYRGHPVAAQAWGLGLAASGSSAIKASALLEKARKMMGDNALLAEARRKLASNTAS
ncbi:MAG: tetratricopeptide repeat protein, partial [Sphingomonadaceae bacterium]|nr:tetratricopeptide repeat protein [Sphingomonadaceae bacterium]